MQRPTFLHAESAALIGKKAQAAFREWISGQKHRTVIEKRDLGRQTHSDLKNALCGSFSPLWHRFAKNTHPFHHVPQPLLTRHSPSRIIR